MATVDPQYSEESSSWSSDEEDNSSESESESESEAASAELTSESVCEECSFKDRQIEQLRQKLEHAVHMNKLLSQECQRLKGAVREAKWKSGRSSDWAPPTLPNEIWHAIFQHATKSKGQSLSHLPGDCDEATWEESLLARRSIPLVCRQWAAAGSEFLYNHMVFYRTRQLDRIISTFNVRPEYLDRCRNVELIAIHVEFDPDDETAFYDSALLLLQSLPRIQSLAINPLHETVCPSINAAIQAVLPKLQTLHLSSTIHRVSGSILQESPVSLEGTHKDGVKSDWNNLRTLSLVNGVWWYSSPFGAWSFKSLARIEFPHLRTICLEWPGGLPRSLFPLLENHPSLTEVYIGGDAEGFSYFMAHFEKVLNILRCLKVLSVRSSSTIVQSIDWTENTQSHDWLETIIVKNIRWNDRSHASGIWPIFRKLNRGELPACKVIELGGDFFDGCVDANIFSKRSPMAGLGALIRICKQRGVALVNEAGQELFFWADRHGIRYTSKGDIRDTSDQDSDSITSLDADSWTEDDGRRTETPSWKSTDDDGGLDDSEDTPYIYHSRRPADVRPVEDSDSD